MRHVIWDKEDYFQFDSKPEKIMEMDAMNISFGETVPLLASFDMGAHLVGTVTDIRCEDGELSGEVTYFSNVFSDEKMERLRCRLGGKYTHVHTNEQGDYVLSSILSSVSLMSLDDAPPPRTDRDNG